jgi:hypothetical protein
MAAYLLPDTDQSLIVLFDQTVSEGHEATAEVTEHPVEKGSNVADHVRQNPQNLTLEMFVTNTPIVDLGRGSSRFGTCKSPGPRQRLRPVQGLSSTPLGQRSGKRSTAAFGP